MPICELCGAEMVRRTARRGPRAGRKFCGYLDYPRCKKMVNIDGHESQIEANNDGAGELFAWSQHTQVRVEQQKVDNSLHLWI